MSEIQVGSSRPGAADPDEHVGAGQPGPQVAADLPRVGARRQLRLGRRQRVVVGGEAALAVPDDDVGGAAGEEQGHDRRAGSAGTGHDDPGVGQALLHHPQRVGERGGDDDRRTVLVVVEDRDVQALPEPALDLEAARRRDVLQVDAAEAGRDHLDGAHDLVGVLAGQADRPGVDVGEPLEQRGLALHHRQRRTRSDVAEPQHRRAVGDHRDRVALDRQLGTRRRGCGRAPG